MKRGFLAFSTLVAAALNGAAGVAGSFSPDANVAPSVAEPVPTFDWSGGYAGIQLGYVAGDMNVTFDEDSAPAPWQGDPDPNGHGGGLYGGYNWTGKGALIYGVDAQVNWWNADGFGDEYVFGGQTGWGFEGEINMSAALRGRIGYAMDRTMVYAAGGLAYADFDVRYYDNGSALRDSLSDELIGWTVGFGVERAFTDKVVGRIDISHSDFGTETYGIDEGGGVYDADVDLSASEIKLGVAFRF